MDLQEVLAISGMPGLFKLVATRNNGLIIEDFDSKKRSFISLRKHQITPLESVGIYTYSDVEKISTALEKMRDSDVQPPRGNVPSRELYGYLRVVIPDFDEDRVHLTDIKKLIKWYYFLKDRQMLTGGSDEEE